MKPTMFVLTIAVAAFMIACNTTTPTGPFGNGLSAAHQIAKTHPGMTRIPLSGIPREPHPLSGLVFEISGYVEYTMVRLPGSGNLFDIQLTTDARLRSEMLDEPDINVAGSNRWQISVSEEGVTFRDVSFLLPNREDRLALFITFQITQGSMEVADVALVFLE